MRLREALDLPSLAGTRVVAGMSGLDRDVRGIHAIDIPEPSLYVTAGQVLLTTGYAWPRDEQLQLRQIESLVDRGLVGMGLAVPHFFDHFSESTRAVAERLDLALLEIPWEVPFAQIVEDVHRAILAEQYRVIERSERIHRELTSAASEGATLEELARTLGHLINRNVSFEDREGRTLASYRARDVADEAVGGDNRHRCPIQLGGRTIGTVCITDIVEPLTELEYRAAEHAALVAALKIAHQRELSVLESRLGHAFVASLLEGTFDPTPQAIERARLVGFDPQGSYVVALFVLEESLPIDRDAFLHRERVANYVRRRMDELHLPPLISVAHNHVAAVTRVGGIAEIWHKKEHPDVAIVVGRAHDGFAGIRESYREALQLVPYRRRGVVGYFDELIFPRVIMGDPEARGLFLRALFAPLESDKHGDTIKMTLLTYVGAGFQVRETAKELAIHPNTVRYRLDRASQLMEQSLDDPDTRFRLQFALHLLGAVHNGDGESL